MKNTIVAFVGMALLLTAQVKAEDVVSVAPTAVNTSQSSLLRVVVNTSGYNAECLQFDLSLPAGVALDVNAMSKNDAADTSHNFEVSKVDGTSNDYRVIMWSKEGTKLSSSMCAVLNCPVTTSSSITPGFHAVKTKNMVIGKDINTAGARMELVSSYVFVGSTTYTGGEAKEFSDLSALTGYIPSFVCNDLNLLLSRDKSVVKVDMQNIDSAAEPILTENNNALYYVKKGSNMAEIVSGALYNKSFWKINGYAPNIVWRESGYYYSPFMCAFANEGYGVHGDFRIDEEWMMADFYVDREFTPNQWSTVCFPYSLDEELTSLIMETFDVEMYELSGFDADNQSLSFSEVKEIEANTPYVVRFTGEDTSFPLINNAIVESSAELHDIVVDNDARMVASFSNYLISSDDVMTYYAYDAVNGQFRKVGSNVKVSPFRCYIAIPTANVMSKVQGGSTSNGTPSVFKALATKFNPGNFISTGITDIDNTITSSVAYNVAGQRIKVPAKGNIVIRGGKKYFVK